MIVGVLGAGQLGRMLGLAALPLGVSVRLYDEAPGAPAACVGPLTVGRFDDLVALDRFAEGCDVVTYEFENVPVAAAEHLVKSRLVWPPPAALRVAQDRVAEKSFFRDLGVGVPGFEAVDSPDDLTGAIESLGLPAVLKTRRLGYDGKGQAVVRTREEAARAMERLSAHTPAGAKADLILEAFVPFVRELSVIGVRAEIAPRFDPAKVGVEHLPIMHRAWNMAFYPVVQNRHQHGILAESVAPAPGVSPETQSAAEAIARKALESLDYIGVLAIELFELDDGRLLVNEMAPRVHNSGHWTIEGAVTSQFENHMRAVAGLPLGSTEMAGGCCAAMLNAIGEMPDAAAVLRVRDAHLHDYGKLARPGRKVGHVTVRRPDDASLAKAVARMRPIVPFKVEA